MTVIKFAFFANIATTLNFLVQINAHDQSCSNFAPKLSITTFIETHS